MGKFKLVKAFHLSNLLLWMFIIFYMSHQTGTNSSAISNSFLNHIIEVIPINADILHSLIRKLAHIIEYFILAILVYNVYNTKNHYEYFYASIFISSALYAVLDEIHQLYIPGRAGSILDVGIDCIGIISAIFIIKKLNSRKN